MEKFFTVLISVYRKEDPAFLEKCLQSMIDQTVLPYKIIIVRDGTLGSELNEVLIQFQRDFPSLFRIEGYDENRGLGQALQFGLKFIETPWIARMDADDVAVPTRFEEQINFLKGHPDVDVLGSFLSEFKTDEKKVLRIKEVPESHQQIKDVAHLFNPMNHMTVFMRKESVEKAGGYQDAPFFEDYYLWVRMLAMNMKFYNLPKPLVYGRIGNDMVGKRHGLQYLKHEYAHFKRMRSLGFLSPWLYYRALILRLPLRVLPKRALAAIYAFALRKRPTSSTS